MTLEVCSSLGTCVYVFFDTYTKFAYQYISEGRLSRGLQFLCSTAWELNVTAPEFECIWNLSKKCFQLIRIASVKSFCKEFTKKMEGPFITLFTIRPAHRNRLTWRTRGVHFVVSTSKAFRYEHYTDPTTYIQKFFNFGIISIVYGC